MKLGLLLTLLLVPLVCGAQIRTPEVPATPRINGPHVYGERPGRPFFYHVPITGKRPITIIAEGLPAGLSLDPIQGNITGSVSQAGECQVNLKAKNALGGATSILHIVIGNTICLTPPMGWNSWNCYQAGVDEAKVRAATNAMVSSGLIEHGWTYINIDDGWAGAPGSRDAAGHILLSSKFVDTKRLGDFIHDNGLKFGIYTTPGPITCAGFEGSYGHESTDLESYVDWGVDYLKYDRCTIPSVDAKLQEERYAQLLSDHAEELNRLGAEVCDLMLKAHHASGNQRTDEARMGEIQKRLDELHSLVPPEKQAEIADTFAKLPWQKMGALLTQAKRDIVYSISQGGRDTIWKWAPNLGANLWRVTRDIRPSWKSLETHAFAAVDAGLDPYAGPGHWNDPDMLEIGNGNLTPDEDYLHMTAWCMLSAPLLIGCDMTKMSPLTISILSNDEVLAIDQDALGKEAYRVKQEGKTEVWMKPLQDGSLAIAFFNRGEAPADLALQWADLKLTGSQQVRDLWRQKDIGQEGAGYSVNVAAHGAELFKISKSHE